MKDNLRSMVFPTTVAHSIQHNGGVKKMHAEWQWKDKWGWWGWLYSYVPALRMYVSLWFSDREKRSLHLPKRKEIVKSGERAGFPRLCWRLGDERDQREQTWSSQRVNAAEVPRFTETLSWLSAVSQVWTWPETEKWRPLGSTRSRNPKKNLSEVSWAWVLKSLRRAVFK